MPLSKVDGSMSSARRILGTLMVCGPTPCTASRCSACMSRAGELVAVAFQAEQHAQAHVVDAALHGAVHGFGVVIVIMLGARGMELFVALLVVGLLEQDVGADARLPEHPVIFHRGCGDIHIHPADGAVFCDECRKWC